MSYQVLARKWRPRAFKDMVGQEPILRMLANALEQKRLHHAYLLTGTRGVGKTTLARILAKCLNCETGITATPCDTCATCHAIDQGQFLDLFEIDAASRTKVEDTREILDNVLYPPTQGRYKIYLIDEVHMLSNHSFNALLKTLEEPPEHVKFLLATTDPKRLPVTILSRCLQFHLKPITPEQIANHLQTICQAEQLSYEPAALEKLAKAADGSMRDALSLLDQAIAYGQGTVKASDVHAMLGSMAQDEILPLVEALAGQDGQQLFEHARRLSERAPDFRQALEELIHIFHQIALVQVVPEQKNIEAVFVRLAQQFKPEDVQLYYQIALLARRDLSYTPTPQQGFEMALLRMLAFKPALASHESTVASTIAKPAIASAIVAPAPPAKIATPTPPASEPETGTVWRDVLPKLELTGMAYALAANCMLIKIEDNKVFLALSANHQPMLNPKLKERLAEALSRHFKHTIQLNITISADELSTPARQQLAANHQRLNTATESVLQDPHIKQLIDMYDATVEVSLVD